MSWEIDPIHSQVSFAIRVMSVTTTRGRFNRVRGHLHIDEQNPASSWVEAEVDAASINTHMIFNYRFASKKEGRTHGWLYSA